MRSLNWDKPTLSGYNENLQALHGSLFPSVTPARRQRLQSPRQTQIYHCSFSPSPFSSTPKALFPSVCLDLSLHLLNLNHSSDRERGTGAEQAENTCHEEENSQVKRTQFSWCQSPNTPSGNPVNFLLSLSTHDYDPYFVSLFVNELLD